MNFNFAKSAAIVNVTSLDTQVNTYKNGILNMQPVPKEVINSMELQGLTSQFPFSPGQPINPVNPVGSDPRVFEYTIGQNIVQKPRSTENVSFETMRNIIELYDLVQIAIEVRQDELRNLDWDIVPIDEDNSNDAKKYESEIKQIRDFFQKPDGHTLFDDFQNQLAYDWLGFDALTIAPQFTRGGKLGALYAVDGTSFTPMIDYYGRIPQAPAPAYVQWINGMPWTWLTRDGLIYKPHRKRTNKIYGFSPVEYLLNNINTDIRHQLYFLQYFTEGSIPDTWINAPEDVGNPEQIKAFQRLYDTVMIGDQTQKHKARFIPFGSKVTQAKDVKFDIEFSHFLLGKTCAAFKTTPSELGFTEKVNKSSGETQENVQYRRSIKPSAKFFSSIYTGIIHQYFGFTNLKFKYLNVEEQEDMLMMAQRDEIYIKNGVISADLVAAQRLGLAVDPKNPVPRVMVAGTNIIAVDDIIAQSKANVAKALGNNPNEEIEEDDNAKDDSSNVKSSKEAQKAAQDFFISPVGKRKNSLNSQIK